MRSFWLVCAAIGGFALAPTVASAQGKLPIPIERPGQHEFIRDLAGLIDERDKHEIRQICAKLLREKATPIIVVTIESMAKYNGAGMRIDIFARLLFDEWGIGHAKLRGEPWNTGILLLVSKEDRKARIELGAGWAHDKDAQCQRIMSERIVPFFKRGDFSGGILSGVESLDKMAHGLEIPDPPLPWWTYALIGAFFAVVFTSFVSLVQSGTHGWGFVFWSITIGIVTWLLIQMLTNRSSNGYGGDGGSFDGGCSGGGGADGGW